MCGLQCSADASTIVGVVGLASKATQRDISQSAASCRQSQEVHGTWLQDIRQWQQGSNINPALPAKHETQRLVLNMTACSCANRQSTHRRLALKLGGFATRCRRSVLLGRRAVTRTTAQRRLAAAAITETTSATMGGVTSSTLSSTVLVRFSRTCHS